MKVSNIMMFDFNSSDSLTSFVDASQAHGLYSNTQQTVFVRTGKTSGVGITVYQNEKARLAGHEIRQKGLQTDIFSKHLKDTVVL
jgi:hypothetical protein